MEALTGVWVAFCGESESSPNASDCRKTDISACSMLLGATPSVLCIKNGLSLFMNILLLFMFFFSLTRKRSRAATRNTHWPQLSRLQRFSAVYSGLLGLGYTVLGFWILQERWRISQAVMPLHLWLVPLFQGLTWTLLGLTVSLRTEQLEKNFLRLWTFISLFLAVFLTFTDILVAATYKELSIKIILDFLLVPGALSLVLCIRYSRRIEYGPIDGSDLCTPLNGENKLNLDEHVTPFSKASLLSRLSFWWMNSIMKKGWESPFEEKDIPKLGMEDQAQGCYALFSERLNQEKENNKSKSPSIFWTLVFCHRREIVVSGFFAFLKIVTVSSGPMLLNAFIRVAEGNESFKYEGYILAISLFLAKVLESLSQRQWYFRTRRIGLQLRSLLSAAIYQKQLRLSNEAKMRHSAGEIMNYLNVDAYRIGEFPFWFHQTWTTSFQLCLALAILYNAVGSATASALIVIILTVLCNAPLAKLQHKFQTKLMQAQDERLKAVSEALVNMKVLKLYAWEMHFKSVIEELRKVEYKWLSAFQLRKAYNSFLFWTSPVLVSTATFATCYLLKVPLQASNVFTFVATLRLVQDPVRSIPDVLGVVIQAKVAFARIVNFLEAPELVSGHIKKDISEKEHEYSIYIKSAHLAWERDAPKPTLRNITVMARPGQKVAICGEVGSGKSTLLAAILGEVPITEGNLQVFGTIAYVSQAAWIQSGTIRDNILFGSPMNKQKYQNVIEKCSLAKDLEMMPFGDLTEIGERGVNLSGGQKQRIQLARAVYQDANIYLLDDPFSAVDAHTASSLFNECVMDALSQKTVFLVTHQVDFLPAFDIVLLMSEGEIVHSAPYHKLLYSSSEFQDLVNAHQDTMSSEKLANGVSSQTGKDRRSSTTVTKLSVDANLTGKVATANQLIKQEEKEQGDTGFKPYIQYLSQNKGFLYFGFAIFSHASFVGTQILQNAWMAANVQNPHVSMLRLITVYSIIGFGGSAFLFCRSLFVVVLGLQTSKSLFAQLLKSLFRAPMSFYDSTPLGRILSRISSDLSIVDLDVPFSLAFACCATINAYSNLGVLSVVTWPVLFVAVPIIYFSLRLQRYYFSTAKELMRINGTTKSVVANHLSESISGAMTVRAFREEQRFLAKSMELIDKNASPFFHNFAASEWLIQRLETLSAAVLSSSALAMVLLPSGSFSPGFIGMALSYGLSLNMSLVFSIQNQCILGNYIISVERINQYMYVNSEAPELIEGSRPAVNWPDVGKVEIQDLKVSARYSPRASGHYMHVQGGQKIGIVGRTGSGKTTLISALFRLVEPAGGKIIIDGLDISAIGLHDLRSRLGIIPQEPTLFHGTVRYNLDPLQQHSDHEIWEVLGKCQLRETVQEKKDGLDALVVEDGSNWSMGQRQLFCLGRALLRRSKILVLDEATASIDNATDSILQKTIRTEFADSTVITVAHRIPTVMDCTMVLAIRDGQLMEFDQPLNLMKREGSLFRELVKEYWSHASSSTGN